MKEITIKDAFEKEKKSKISYNVYENTLKMIDELAEILGITRTQMLDFLIVSGIKSQTNFMIKTWEEGAKDKKYQEKEKQEKIKKKIKTLEEFKKRWNVDEFLS
jgi:hypothetical protein